MMKIKPESLLTLLVSTAVLIFSSVHAEVEIMESNVDRYSAGIALAYERATVKSEHDLERELGDEASPLHALSDRALEVFLEGLVFTGSGLGGLNYEPLIMELEEEQIYQVFKLFGVQFESGLYSPRIFDAEDALTYELMGCQTYGDNMSERRGNEISPMCGGDRPSSVCVQFEHGRDCAWLPYNYCFANCSGGN